MVHIKKIVHRTNDKLYLLFSDDEVRVLDKHTLYDLPDWQIDIIEKNWMRAYVDDFGGLVFNKKFDIGGDTLKSDTKKISESELFEIIQNKRIAKKKIIQALASLL